jgi:hypothetical protein
MSRFTNLFLAAVGGLYLALSVWCSIAPGTTSEKVGFAIESGAGQSEFLTIYGGLELGLALFFLLPLFKTRFQESALWFCTILHGCLVLFRSASFALFSDIGGMTYKLAIGEWVIFLISIGVLFAMSGKYRSDRTPERIDPR